MGKPNPNPPIVKRRMVTCGCKTSSELEPTATDFRDMGIRDKVALAI